MAVASSPGARARANAQAPQIRAERATRAFSSPCLRTNWPRNCAVFGDSVQPPPLLCCAARTEPTLCRATGLPDHMTRSAGLADSCRRRRRRCRRHSRGKPKTRRNPHASGAAWPTITRTSLSTITSGCHSLVLPTEAAHKRLRNHAGSCLCLCFCCLRENGAKSCSEATYASPVALLSLDLERHACLRKIGFGPEPGVNNNNNKNLAARCFSRPRAPSASSQTTEL